MNPISRVLASANRKVARVRGNPHVEAHYADGVIPGPQARRIAAAALAERKNLVGQENSRHILNHPRAVIGGRTEMSFHYVFDWDVDGRRHTTAIAVDGLTGKVEFIPTLPGSE